MITVPINQAQFTAAGLAFTHADGAPVAYLSVISTDPKIKPVPVGVSTDGTSLFFFPDRSASQRAILKIMGIAT